MQIVRVVMFVLLSMVTVYGWALENDQSKKTVSGTAEDIDWVKSTITVRYVDPSSENVDEIDIVVPAGTKMTNGTSSISFSDILQSDQVTVDYYDDGASGLKAVRITDINQGSRGL